MRVLTLPPDELARLDDRIDEFWACVPLKGSETLTDAADRLARIDAGLDCEWAPPGGADSAPCFYVSGPGQRVLLARILDRAPPELAPRLRSGRPPVPLATALAAVEAGGVDFANARFRIALERGHLLGLEISAPGVPHAGHAESAAAAERIVELILEESQFEDWIGAIEVRPGVRRGGLKMAGRAAPEDDSKPLAALATSLTAAIELLQRSLPDEPVSEHVERAEWAILEVKQEDEDEVLSWHDVLLVSAGMPELVHCFLEGSPFASLRFTRHGEHFACLQLEEPPDALEVRLERRRVLEDELDRQLRDRYQGCVIGAGTGTGHGYLFLALERAPRVPRLVAALIEQLLPGARGTLRICDDWLAEEWLPIPRATTGHRADLG